MSTPENLQESNRKLRLENRALRAELKKSEQLYLTLTGKFNALQAAHKALAAVGLGTEKTS